MRGVKAARHFTALENARLATAEMLYGNLGLLMDAFRANPDAAADLFDLAIIRHPRPQRRSFDFTPGLMKSSRRGAETRRKGCNSREGARKQKGKE